jgi:SpoVK/Ycf46/Vps4 family AAA+-type ATPase
VQLYEVCNSFKVDLENNEERNRRESESNNNILMRDYLPKEPSKEPPQVRGKSNSQSNQANANANIYQSNLDKGNEYKINPNVDKKWDRFGGKAPFQYLNEKDDEMNGGVENERYNKARKDPPVENVVYSRKPISTSQDKKPEKDPMVWDPPEKKEIKKAPVKNLPSQAPSKNQPKKVDSKQSQDVDKRRNYDKPWKLPEEKKSSNNQNKEKEKSSFLMHCYPDGVGPDSDLIEMLEKEVVDTNPNVKFEDIAELDKAKNVLKEAVLLPLLMPDYFKV